MGLLMELCDAAGIAPKSLYSINDFSKMIGLSNQRARQIADRHLSYYRFSPGGKRLVRADAIENYLESSYFESMDEEDVEEE